MKCRHGKKTLSPILIAFLSWRVLSQSLSRASKGMNSPKTTGADDIKKDAAQRETFLSSELGHSQKRNVKLLGREQRSDFHHNRTTLSKHAGFSLVYVSFRLASGNFILSGASFQSEWQCAKSFGNYVRVSSYLWMWRAPHSWLRGYKPLFHTRLMCHSSKTEG